MLLKRKRLISIKRSALNAKSFEEIVKKAWLKNK
jgi:hypothetical protein